MPRLNPDIDDAQAAGRGVGGLLEEIDARLASFRNLIEDSRRRIDALEKARKLLLEGLGGPALTGTPARPEPARPPAQSASPRAPRRGTPPPARGPRRGTQTENVERIARKVLLREGRPLARADLLTLIEAEGYHVLADNPAKRVGKILWASHDFEHVGSGYWVKGAPRSDGP